MIYGPPILNDSPFLLAEVNEYNKGEFGKKIWLWKLSRQGAT